MKLDTHMYLVPCVLVYLNALSHRLIWGNNEN
jgi:hypothetical protein